MVDIDHKISNGICLGPSQKVKNYKRHLALSFLKWRDREWNGGGPMERKRGEKEEGRGGEEREGGRRERWRRRSSNAHLAIVAGVSADLRGPSNCGRSLSRSVRTEVRDIQVLLLSSDLSSSLYLFVLFFFFIDATYMQHQSLLSWFFSLFFIWERENGEDCVFFTDICKISADISVRPIYSKYRAIYSYIFAIFWWAILILVPHQNIISVPTDTGSYRPIWTGVGGDFKPWVSVGKDFKRWCIPCRMLPWLDVSRS